MTLAMSGATPEDAGLASGLVNTTQQVGGALGLAVLATLSTDPHRQPARPSGDSTAAALTGGYHLAFAIGAGLVVVALAVARLGAPFPHERRAGGARLPGRAPVRGGVGRRRRAVPEAALRSALGRERPRRARRGTVARP